MRSWTVWCPFHLIEEEEEENVKGSDQGREKLRWLNGEGGYCENGNNNGAPCFKGKASGCHYSSCWHGDSLSIDGEEERDEITKLVRPLIRLGMDCSGTLVDRN